MRILFSSNSPHACSGYGVQSRHIVDGLRAMGHEVALAPNYGFHGGAVEASGMRIYPIWREKIGQDVIATHAKHWDADLVITLYDLWPYDVDFAARLKRPWVPYFPQDSYPPCPTVIERAKQADYPIAMSKFGLESMAEQGVECAYIPHGVDTDTYRPLDKAAVREELKLPADAFIVLMVAANQSFPSRKAFPENLAAFAKFHAEHPNSLLYLHTTAMPRGPVWDGIEMPRLVAALGIGKAVRYTDEYALVLGLPDTEMAKIYNCADVLLAASMGEGFGIPIIEAQASGLPVITTNFSAMPEITFNGVTVSPLQMAWTPINTWQAIPPIEGIARALTLLYERPGEEARIASNQARQKIITDYSWPVVVEQWRVLLEQIERGDKPSTERLYHYTINGVDVDVYDDKLSFTTGCVASELTADRYGIEKIDFQPGDVILDIGGHTGLFAMYAAKRWPGVRVLSFEPSPTNAERFGRALNREFVKDEQLQIELCPQGVTGDGRSINLALSRSNTGGTTEFCKPNGHLVEHADTLTLDQIFERYALERVKLLKLDCEGAEHELLIATNYLDHIDYISGEFHINAALEAQGYSIANLYKYCTQFLPAERVTYTSCRMAD